MRPFDTLTEQEVLALAIALEEEDARIYDDFADGLKENHPEQAQKLREFEKRAKVLPAALILSCRRRHCIHAWM